MAHRLDGLGYHLVAADTREILARLDAIAPLLVRLEKPWKAIEWWDSCDWCEETARRDVDEYMAERFPGVNATPPWRRSDS